MKKVFALALMLLAAVLLVSCGTKEETKDDGNAAVDTEVSVDVDAIVRGIVDRYGLTTGFVFTSSSTEPGEYLDEDLILGYYGDAVDVPDFSKISDYCVYIDESNADVYIDVGLFRMADPSYAKTFLSYLTARVDDKIAEADQYPTRDVPTLEAAVFETYGDYVYYVVSYDVKAIAAEIEDALGK
ncbi:MAG: DUF4358 domain-containing protein [Eubacteriales bacterium]